MALSEQRAQTVSQVSATPRTWTLSVETPAKIETWAPSKVYFKLTVVFSGRLSDEPPTMMV
jgi:hypothetical protein